MFQNIKLAVGKIVGCKGKIICESLRTLRLHEVSLVNGEYKKFPMKLTDVMESKMLYSKFNDVVICNYSSS